MFYFRVHPYLERSFLRTRAVSVPRPWGIPVGGNTVKCHYEGPFSVTFHCNDMRTYLFRAVLQMWKVFQIFLDFLNSFWTIVRVLSSRSTSYGDYVRHDCYVHYDHLSCDHIRWVLNGLSWLVGDLYLLVSHLWIQNHPYRSLYQIDLDYRDFRYRYYCLIAI